MSTPLSKRLTEAKHDLGISFREICRRAGQGGHPLSNVTAVHCVNGQHGDVRPGTLQALSCALRIPYSELAELAGHAPLERNFRMEGKVVEHADALTFAQSEIVKSLIRLFAEGNRKRVQR